MIATGLLFILALCAPVEAMRASGFALPLPPSGIQFTSGVVICFTGSADPTVNLAIGSTTNFINLYMQ